MTIIGRLRQRKERKSIGTKLRSPLKHKVGGTTSQQSLDVIKFPLRNPYNAQGSPRLLEVDLLTMKAMKVEVEDLLMCSKKPVTVTALASAFTTSNRVANLYANPGNHKLMDRMMIQIKNMTIRRSKQGAQEVLERRYSLVNSLNFLEKLPDSHKQTIDSWDQAVQVLEKIFIFPKEETIDSNKESKSADESAGVEKYKAALKSSILAEKASHDDIQPMRMKWKQVLAVTPPKKLFRGRLEEQPSEDALLLSQLREKEAELEPQKSSVIDEVEERLRVQEKEEEAKNRASSLMRPLSAEEHALVKNAMYGIGPGNEIIAKCGSDTVQRASMQTLQPGQWLGDEIISHFLLMLSNRDEEMCQKDPSRKRCHFFKSFFFTKLLNEGHANPNIDGTYDYKNVKRWSKKVPGKDIFKLDKVIFPINQSRMHWICAVAFITEKRIQMYDSMGSDDPFYVETIFRYLQDEHKDKKGKPLPDIDQWQLIPSAPDTPRQRNGYDCGVFTCMAADFLSKDCPLVYSQEHITQCRERIALSIMKGKAIM